jgi:hypothetical protein
MIIILLTSFKPRSKVRYHIVVYHSIEMQGRWDGARNEAWASRGCHGHCCMRAPIGILQEANMLKHASVALSMILSSLLVLPAASVATDTDLAAGTWKLDTVRRAAGDRMSPASHVKIVRIEARKDELRLVLDTVDSLGRLVRVEFAGKYDGKDYPVRGLPDADTASLRKIDTYTVDCVYKKDGIAVKDQRIVVSSDWKRATVLQKKPVQRELDFTIVSVWKKQ